MTGYTVNTGSTEKFSEGWDRIFGGSTAKKTAKPAAKAKQAAESKAGKKVTSKQAAQKSRTSGKK